MPRTVENIKAYYQELTAIDIGAVARDLLKVTRADTHTLYCDCPVHGSRTKESLHVSLEKQQWICRGCAVGGDVLHLVEWVQHQTVTKGRVHPMPASHRRARDWLATRVGLARLEDYGLSAHEVSLREQEHVEAQRVRDALTALSTLYLEALLSPSGRAARDFLVSHYPITEDTWSRLKVGWVSPDDWEDSNGRVRKAAQYELQGIGDALSDSDLRALGGPYSQAELLATGAFSPDVGGGESIRSTLNGRIWFPYWSRGHVVYAIGRAFATEAGKQGKYKKLTTRAANAEHVSAAVRNDILWGADCLLESPARVVQTEGITDAIVLKQNGFAVISPVTVRARQEDWPRIGKQLQAHNIRALVIAQDNEISDAGLRGALSSAEHLEPYGVEVRLVELTLDEEQIEARARLAKLGIHQGIHGKALEAILRQLSDGERSAAEQDLDRAKQDVASWFRTHTAEEFERLLDGALLPLELAISRMPAGYDAAKDSLDPILDALAVRGAMEVERALKAIHEKLGRTVSLNALKSEVASRRIRPAQAEAPEKAVTCRAAVERAINANPRDTARAHADAARAAFAWFKSNGGRFFVTPRGEPFFYWETRIYWLDSNEKTVRRALAALLLEQTGLVVDCTPGGRVFVSTLASLAVAHGEERETFKWIHTDILTKRVWLSLADREQHIVRIDENGVTVMRNGDNADGMLLLASPQMTAVHYQPASVTPAELDALLAKHLSNQFACAWPEDREFLVQWIAVYGLLELAGTRPIMRVEGGRGSGKTTATKLLSILIDGNEAQHKISTTAADYVDAASNPLLVRDNIEVVDFTDDYRQFLLTSAGGVVKQKRAGNTDSGLVQERARCLLVHSGIEPVGAELPELLSRSFILTFSKDAQSEGFVEPQQVAELNAVRSKILGGLFERWSRILRALHAGAGARILTLFAKTFGSHSKSRCNDYLMLMYLFSIIDDPNVDALMVTLRPSFESTMKRLIEETEQTASESTHLAGILVALFESWRAVRSSTDTSKETDFRAKFPTIRFDENMSSEHEGCRTRPLTMRGLFLGLSMFARSVGLPFKYRSPVQLGCRLQNELDTMRGAGFEIEKTRSSKGITYVITQTVFDGPREAARRPSVQIDSDYDDQREGWFRAT